MSTRQIIDIAALVQVMKREGMSQSELARRINVTQGAIQQIVSGSSKRSKFLTEIAYELRCQPSDLLCSPPITETATPDASAERCGSCRFWLEDTRHRTPDDPTFGFGSCRLHPPRIIGDIARAIMPRPEYGDQIEPEIDTVRLTTATLYPAVTSSDWCGQFEERAPCA